jgi:hypothetical protein
MPNAVTASFSVSTDDAICTNAEQSLIYFYTQIAYPRFAA